MKKFISVFLSLTMIFTSLGTVNTQASNLDDMYLAYKYLISSFSSSFKSLKNFSNTWITYSLYDIDKDNSAELIVTGGGEYGYYDQYRQANVYTFKNGQAHLCGTFTSDDFFTYHTVVADEYGNGFGIHDGTGDGWSTRLYVLNGTQLIPTQHTISYDYDPANITGEYVYFLNGKKLSKEAAKNFYECRNSDTSNLSYLNEYFKR